MSPAGNAEDETRDPQPAPQLSVLRGAPTPEELAALVVALAARRPARDAGSRPRAGPAWGSPAALLREVPAAGPGAWQASARAR